MKIETTFCSFIPPNIKGMGLLDYLVMRFPYHSAEEWERRIDDGRVTVDGAQVSIDHPLKNGMKLCSEVTHIEPDLPQEVEVIAVEEEFAVLGKSAEVPVTRTGQVIWNTFVQQARRKLQNPEVRLLHRLDRETSGLILCSLSARAAKLHQKRLDSILLRKFYLAVVQGEVEWEWKQCSGPLREAPDHPARARMEVHPEGKPSESRFYRIAHHPQQSLVLAEIRTGRKHQIRAHLAQLGHPLVGDKLYTGEGEAYIAMATDQLSAQQLDQLGAPHQLLHSWAAQIQLPHHSAPTLYRSSLLSEPFRKAVEMWPQWENNSLLKLDGLLEQSF